MSIDFSTYTGWAIPDGNVVQVADASGAVLWALSGDKVVLEVAKQTADTYVGGTTYSGEEFILLDIYPKTNGTVTVTYGGLTKTITDTSGAAEPNAQQVFFGTFNGVADSVATPASGTLTVEGDYRGVGCGTYSPNKLGTTYSACVTAVVALGITEIIPSHAFANASGSMSVIIPNSVTYIGDYAFQSCTNLTSVTIPNSVTYIGSVAFSYCINLTSITIPNSVTYIGDGAFLSCINLTSITIPNSVTDIEPNTFNSCINLTSITIPSNVTYIGMLALAACSGLTSVIFANTSGWWVSDSSTATSGTAVDVTDATNNVTLITDTYKDYYWHKS